MAGSGSGNAPARAAPTHHGGSGSEATLENFVPADQASSVPRKECVHLLDKPTVQLVRVLELEPLHLSLHLGVVGPMPDVGLVAADMDALAGKQLDHFGQHVLEKGDRLGAGCDQAAGLGPALVERQAGEAARVDGQLGVSHDGRPGVENGISISGTMVMWRSLA